MNYRQRLMAFFGEYVTPQGGVLPDGSWSNALLRDAAQLLLKERVFESVEDMKLEAIKTHDVCLPDWLFK